VFAVAVLIGFERPLWYDELYTYYVSLQPSPGATLRALLDGADNNPPVDYVLRQIIMAAFGPSEGAFRLPSAIVFVASLLALYAFVRKRTFALAAFAAFTFPVATLAMRYSHEGRGYALLFAAAAFSMLAWQRATEKPDSAARLALLAGALTLGPFSHFYGVLNYLPVVAGEAWRSIKCRRIEWRIIGAATVSVATLPLLLPFASNAAKIKEGFWAQNFTPLDPFVYQWHLYGPAVAPTVLALLAVGAIMVAWPKGTGAGARRRELLAEPNSATRERPSIPAHELVAALVLAFAPFSAYLLAEMYTGALVPRYTIGGVAGVSLLVGYASAWGATVFPRATAVAVTIFFASALALQGRHLVIAQAPVPEPLASVLRSQSNLPVAVDSPLQYLVYQHYLPGDVARRLVYPMDPSTALDMYGANSAEISLRGLGQIVPLNVPSYREFVDSTPRFYVVAQRDRPLALLRALQRDGYRVQLQQELGEQFVLLIEHGG
jgi:4-amino-4-deoxy-L-arabinose transferase-like glycosyltransferase